MPAAELAEWQLFYELEPWGSHYEDLRAGLVASTVLNVNRDREVRPEPFLPLELVVWNDTVRAKEEERLNPPPMSPEAQSDALRLLLGRPPKKKKPKP